MLLFHSLRTSGLSLVFTLFIVLGFGISDVLAGDTLKVMVYNILQYPSASNYITKNGYLDTIVRYVRPHIIGVNELNPPASNADLILNQVLKPSLSSSYTRAQFSSSGGSPVANMLYYDSAFVRMKAQYSIPTAVREINAYELYYNDPTLVQSNDTTFFTIVLAHFKAGNTPSDESDRTAMSQAIVNWVQSRPVPGNYIVMGDLNVYSSQEGCFQALLNAQSGVRMFDPVNQLGAWSNDSNYANWFTQSTRTTIEQDGGSNGGMDDRLDHLLINEGIRDRLDRVQYIPGSYTIIGQDGLRYNQSITNPSNSQVPPTVAVALYGMSDHLPITAELSFTPSIVSIDDEMHGVYAYDVYPNPSQSFLNIRNLQASYVQGIEIEISDVTGRVLLRQAEIFGNSNEIRISILSLLPGVYTLKICESGKTDMVRRFIRF